MSIVPRSADAVQLPSPPSVASVLPLPHPGMPRSTAKRGTRRMPPEVRRALPPPLTRASAQAAMEGDRLARERGRIVWNVNEQPLVQSIFDMVIPDGLSLRPVRRLGSYRGAPNRLGMYPIIREGRALYLCAESRLEMSWFRALDIDPLVSWMHAQPFAIYWRLGDRAMYHIPDVLVIRDGVPIVCDVKPDAHLAGDAYAQMVTALTAATLKLVDVGFQTLGDIPKQAATNLRSVARYKRANPYLADPVARVVEHRPTTAGGVFALCEDVHVGYEVFMHVLATGMCRVNFEQPFHRATCLEWVG